MELEDIVEYIAKHFRLKPQNCKVAIEKLWKLIGAFLLITYS